MKHRSSSQKGARRAAGQTVAVVVMALALAVSGVGSTLLLVSQPSGLTVASTAAQPVTFGFEAPAESAQREQPASSGDTAAEAQAPAEEPAEEGEAASEPAAAGQPAASSTTKTSAAQTQPAAEQQQSEAPAAQSTEKENKSAAVTGGDIEEENASSNRFVQETPELAAEDPLSDPAAASETSIAQRAAQAVEESAVLLTPEQITQALDEGALSSLPEGQTFDANDENCLTWLWNWLFGSLFSGGQAEQYSGWHTDSNGNTYYYDPSTHTALTGIHTIDGVLYDFDENGVKKDVTFGIDVSKYQSNIDWSQVKSSGVEFVMIRIGYRGYTTGTLVQDPMFESHYAGARAAGLRVGAYAFSQAVNENEAREEAQACVYVLNGRTLDYPLYFDTEASGSSNGSGRADGLSVEDRTKCAIAFCEEVKALGYRPGVYASTRWLTKRLDMSQLSGYSIWNAHYNVASSGVACDIWQGVCDGKVNGYSGGIDINISYIG